MHCMLQHSHCLLVWFEQFARELAEYGQVGEVLWCGCFWGLAELLEHKFYAIPAHSNTQCLGTEKPTKTYSCREKPEPILACGS